MTLSPAAKSPPIGIASSNTPELTICLIRFDLKLPQLSKKTYPVKWLTKSWKSVTVNATEDWLEFTTMGVWDVVWPASSTDNAIARFDLTTGKIIQNWIITESDNWDLKNINAVELDLAPTSITDAGWVLSWNSTDDTMNINNWDGTILQVWQELQKKVRNITGATLTNGTLVYINGAATWFATVDKANANSASTDNVIWMATMDIVNNSNGKIARFGNVRNLDTSSFSEWDELWLSTTDWLFTDVRPQSPDHSVMIWTVIVVDVTNWVIDLNVQHIPNADEILLQAVSWATEDTVQDMHDWFHSAWVITWGVINDIGGWNITVDAWTGWIRTINDKTASLPWFDWSALWSTAIPSDAKRWIWVEFNAWSPQIVVRTADTFNNNDDFWLGNLYYDGTDMHIQNLPRAIWDHASTMIDRMLEVNWPQRANWLILWETWTRNITTSAGLVWQCLTEFPTPAIDTSASDTFASYLWETQSSIWNTQWDNQNYNVAWVLTALGNSRWGNLWFYSDFDDGTLVMQYWNSNATSQANAESEWTPATIAKLLQDGRWLLIARLTFQKSAATGIIASAFDTTFVWSWASDHNSQSWLDGGWAWEFFHLTTLEYANAQWGIAYLLHNLSAAVDPVATDDSWSGYDVGSRWINTTLDKEFVNVDSTVSSAVWIETTSIWWGSQTLQDTYDFSTTPEILTDATRLWLTLKRGSAADTDDVFDIQNWAGSKTASITWAWVIDWTGITKGWINVPNITEAATIINKNLTSLSNTFPITSDPTAVTGADQVINVISLTTAEFGAIWTPNASTLYIITDA